LLSIQTTFFKVATVIPRAITKKISLKYKIKESTRELKWYTRNVHSTQNSSTREIEEKIKIMENK
jgi:hypothetical protein